jgi:hypothetical protein
MECSRSVYRALDKQYTFPPAGPRAAQGTTAPTEPAIGLLVDLDVPNVKNTASQEDRASALQAPSLSKTRHVENLSVKPSLSNDALDEKSSFFEWAPVIEDMSHSDRPAPSTFPSLLQCVTSSLATIRTVYETSLFGPSDIVRLLKVAADAQSLNHTNEALTIYKNIDIAVGKSVTVQTSLARDLCRAVLPLALDRDNNAEMIAYLGSYQNKIFYSAAEIKLKAMAWHMRQGEPIRSAIIEGDDAKAHKLLTELHRCGSDIAGWPQEVQEAGLSGSMDETGSTSFYLAQKMRAFKSLAFLLAHDRAGAARWFADRERRLVLPEENCDLKVIRFAVLGGFGNLLARDWTFQKKGASFYQNALQFADHIKESSTRKAYCEFLDGLADANKEYGRRFTLLLHEEEVAVHLSEKFKLWVQYGSDARYGSRSKID